MFNKLYNPSVVWKPLYGILFRGGRLEYRSKPGEYSPNMYQADFFIHSDDAFQLLAWLKEKVPVSFGSHHKDYVQEYLDGLESTFNYSLSYEKEKGRDKNVVLIKTVFDKRYQKELASVQWEQWAEYKFCVKSTLKLYDKNGELMPGADARDGRHYHNEYLIVHKEDKQKKGVYKLGTDYQGSRCNASKYFDDVRQQAKESADEFNNPIGS